MDDPGAFSERLCVVSNRLPIRVRRRDGALAVQASSGGLVTAFMPLLEKHGGTWIGWPGIVEGEADEAEVRRLIEDHGRDQAVDYRAVIYSGEDRRDFYRGFSNEVIWPLFHDLQSQCVFERRYWTAYEKVNALFADVIADCVDEDQFVWVQDYHLMGVASHLRGRMDPAHLAFFLHTPFPPVDILAKLPWREQILDALLEYDLVGFQTIRDKRNFLQSIEVLRSGVSIAGESGTVTDLDVGSRRVRVGAFPISIDYREFADLAASDDVVERVRRLRRLKGDVCLILGVDRLDYTKGIPQKLRALARCWEEHPELQGRTSLFQVVVPSRTDIPKYDALKTEIERLVGEINGRFSRVDWNPVHYLFGSLDRAELLALYRTAEVGLVTPLKDGMNLVSKEYCACCYDGNGVLVLSEFAGSAAELEKGALLVNPYDREEVSEAICRAVDMERSEKIRRMESVRESIRRHDIHDWMRTFLAVWTDGKVAAPRMERVADQLY